MTNHLKPVKPKDKTAAVLLAIFFWFWTWLYTYERDKKKFWIALSSNILIILLIIASTILSAVVRFSADAPETSMNLFSIFIGFASILLFFTLFFWAIIDTVKKPDAWYQQYPNEPQ